MSDEIVSLSPPGADARVVYGAAPSQFADLRLPSGSGPHPIVVCIHGGYWRVRYDLTHLGHLCAALAERGFATWSLEYRRLGEAGGGFPGTFDDVLSGIAAAVANAERYSLDASRLVLLGHSAGGHLALWAAKQHRPLRGVVALAPVADIARAQALQLSEGVADELLSGTSVERISPRHRLPAGVPQIVVHGTEDDTVPFDIARDYVESALAAGDDARLVTLPGTGHFEPIDPRTDAFGRVAEAVAALLA
jgi:acetyl esterase/lipase